MKPTAIALTGAVIAAVAGLAPAAPAAASEPDITGTFAFQAEDGESATWTLTACPDDAAGCVLVSETGNAKRAPWKGDAHYSVGSWILFVQQPDAILCPDGTSAPGMNTYSWAAVGLSGSASIINKGACGAKPGSVSIPFTLTRIGPPPAAPADLPADPPAAQPPAPLNPPAAGDVPPETSPAAGPEAQGGPLSAESPIEAPAPAAAPAPTN